MGSLKMSYHPDARWNAGKGATPNLSPMIAFGVLWDHALDLEMESVGPKHHHFQSGDFGTIFLDRFELIAASKHVEPGTCQSDVTPLMLIH